MKCYFHRDIDAIAICPSCGKALCEACIKTDNDISGCSDKCIQRISTLDKITITNASNSNTAMKLTKYFSISAGIAFLLFGLFDLSRDRTTGLFPLILGLIIFIYGLKYKVKFKSKQ